MRIVEKNICMMLLWLGTVTTSQLGGDGWCIHEHFDSEQRPLVVVLLT